MNANNDKNVCHMPSCHQISKAMKMQAKGAQTCMELQHQIVNRNSEKMNETQMVE